MGFLKSLFGKNIVAPKETNLDFWTWFQQNSNRFYSIIQKKEKIVEDFIEIISPKLKEVNEHFFFLAGMNNDGVAELIITPDGVISQIALVEDFIARAPNIANWSFIALKQPIDINNVGIEMSGFHFNKDNLFFYDNTNADFPDEINLVIVHPDYSEENKEAIRHGIIIFLDNYLGELNAVTNIDYIDFCNESNVTEQLIPMEKLHAFIDWRIKEFEEKYESDSYSTENDQFSSLEGQLDDGSPLVVVINSTLLDWDRKASHPWILNIEIGFKGNKNGLPEENILQNIYAFEDQITLQLKDIDGYLNIGRRTAKNTRDIFIACKEFREPTRVMEKILRDYQGQFESLKYDIYKDKYWRSLDSFKPQID